MNKGRLIRIVAFSTLPVALVAQPQAPAGAPPETEQTQVPGGRGGTQGRGGGQRGANFPQQQRPPGEPAVIARERRSTRSTCAACHGIDLRGGQQGGPNLLRSQTVPQRQERRAHCADRVRGTVRIRGPAHHRCPVSSSRLTTSRRWSSICTASSARPARRDGRRKAKWFRPRKVLVGDNAAGQTFFAARCASCHSVTGDLQGIASRVTDPRALQDLWISGGGGGGRGRGRGADAAGQQRPATVTVTPVVGCSVEGRLVRIDDFRSTLIQDDGTRRTIVRNGDESQGGREGSRRRSPEARTRAGRQGHAQRDGLSLDDQVNDTHSAVTLLLAAVDAWLSRRTETDSTRQRSSSHSPTRGRPTPATTPAGATARSRRSNQTTVKNLSLAWLSRGFVEGSGPTGRGAAAPAAADSGGAAAVAVAVVRTCR